ncbi:MAG TPA: ROK family protein [Longimicrobiales bacterium]
MRKINTRNFTRATRTTAREVNRQILLNLVREHQPISRADLARMMDVGRGMVTELVNTLIAEGVIHEGATAVAPRGRRPTLLHIRSGDRFVVGVDLRFSRTYLMLCDFSGRQLALENFEAITDPKLLVKTLTARVRRLLDAHGAAESCIGVGVVVGGMVDPRTGRVLNSPQLGWRNVDFADDLASALGLHVAVENAPKACALAHLWLGPRAGEDSDNFVYVTVSEGVGAGIVLNGQVVRGQGHTSGEFGHIPINPDGPICLCGAKGCLEANTSNLATLARYLGYDFSDPDARQRLRESRFTFDDLMARARSGDARAIDAIKQSGHYLGIGLSVIVNGINPARIYVGGEIAQVWDLIADSIAKTVAERALTEQAARTPIIPEPGSDHPRLRGATALIVAPLFAAPQIA